MTRLLRSRTSKSGTIMTTSDSRKDAPHSATGAFETVLPGHKPSIPAGVLDPGVLERMANEFFTALPSMPPAAQPLATAAPPRSDTAGLPEATASAPGVSSAIADLSAYPILTE